MNYCYGHYLYSYDQPSSCTKCVFSLQPSSCTKCVFSLQTVLPRDELRKVPTLLRIRRLQSKRGQERSSSVLHRPMAKYPYSYLLRLRHVDNNLMPCRAGGRLLRHRIRWLLLFESQPPSSSSNSNVCAAQMISSKTSLLGYLDNLGGTTMTKPKKGIATYLDSAWTGGAGIGNYLDSIHKACDTNQPTTKCAEAITNYMGALSNGAASRQCHWKLFGSPRRSE